MPYLRAVFCCLIIAKLNISFCEDTIDSAKSEIDSSGSTRKVTYALSGGRFGDDLLAYFHAKWISYLYNIPLVYKPFHLSDKLALHYSEKPHIETHSRWRKKHWNKKVDPLKGSSKILYSVPYFPESNFELERSLSYKNAYFSVDWNNKDFCQQLKNLVSPTISLPKKVLPKNKVTVAVHVRFGSGDDLLVTEEFRTSIFPLKFPKTNFHIEQLQWLYEFFREAPLYVYLFTDHPNPALIKAEFEANFNGLDIEFACAEPGDLNEEIILEDFFSMAQFDCSIHGESNFSICAGKIADYALEIISTSFYLENGSYFYEAKRFIKSLELEQLKLKISKRLNTNLQDESGM